MIFLKISTLDLFENIFRGTTVSKKKKKAFGIMQVKLTTLFTSPRIMEEFKNFYTGTLQF
jgi:hypothetical protein